MVMDERSKTFIAALQVFAQYGTFEQLNESACLLVLATAYSIADNEEHFEDWLEDKKRAAKRISIKKRPVDVD